MSSRKVKFQQAERMRIDNLFAKRGYFYLC